jgi:hypothetical protein
MALTAAKCRVDQEFHSRAEIDSRTENALSQLYADCFKYSRHEHQRNAKWKPWVHVYLNSDTYQPWDGEYSLQLKLSWSPFRIICLTSIPILLSLTIGIWYMQSSGNVGDAWVISAYIIAAGGGTFRSMDPRCFSDYFSLDCHNCRRYCSRS